MMTYFYIFFNSIIIMNIRILGLCMLFFSGFIFAYSTEISSCQSINSQGYYNLSDNLTSVIQCITISSSNVILDLNQFSIIGDGGNSDYGIIISSQDLTNISIINGNIENFGRAMYACCTTTFSLNLTLENITFRDNSVYDLYLLREIDSHLYINNVSSSSDNFLRYFDSIVVNDSFFNGSSFRYEDTLKSSINSSQFDLSSNFGLRRNSNISLYNNHIRTIGTTLFDDTQGLISKETIFNTSNHVFILSSSDVVIDETNEFYSCIDISTTDDDSSAYFNIFTNISNIIVCIEIQSSNIAIDLNGYSVIGDGGSTDAGVFYGSKNLSNITIMNGGIENFGYGITPCRGSCSTTYFTEVIISNVTFRDNTVYDMYFISPEGIIGINNISSLYRNFLRFTDEVNVKDSYFNDSFRVFDTNTSSIRDTIFDSGSTQQYNTISNLSYFGNTISSASSISSTSTSQNFYYNFSGELIGNFWGDFSCSNNANNYSVSKSPFSYTICNSTDYLVNSISDLAPLINKSLSPTTQQGNFGQIETGITSLFPFSSILSLSVFMLSLIFFFI